jgi:hypothetical protein
MKLTTTTSASVNGVMQGVLPGDYDGRCAIV